MLASPGGGAVCSLGTGRMFRPGSPPLVLGGGARDVVAGSAVLGLLRGGSGNGCENKGLLWSWADATVEP